MVDIYIIHVSKPMECTTPSVTPNVNDGLGVIPKYQCRIVDCNKCTALVQGVGSGRGYAGEALGYRRNLYAFCSTLLSP